jgi:hypothetical protein
MMAKIIQFPKRVDPDSRDLIALLRASIALAEAKKAGFVK